MVYIRISFKGWSSFSDYSQKKKETSMSGVGWGRVMARDPNRWQGQNVWQGHKYTSGPEKNTALLKH